MSPTDRLDLLAPDFRANPYPHYARLRRTAPVSLIDPGGLLAVSRYDDVLAVMKDRSVFSSQGLQPLFRPPWIGANPLADSLLMLDPPEHTRLRTLVTHAFSTRVLPRIEPIARGVARTFAAHAASGAEMDFCEELALEMPGLVIADLLGLEPGQLPGFRGWADDLVSINPATPEERRPGISSTVRTLGGCLDEVIEERRRERRDDLVSELLDATVEGQSLSRDELISFLFLLFVAGFETTAHLLAHSMHVLAAHPQLIPRLCAEPTSIPRFVDEVLRYESSAHATVRVALADATVGGTHVPAGTLVLALVASANRDESRFEDADRFDMDRASRGHLAFGHGIHACLGAALARAEMRIALEELLPRIRAVHLSREPVWNQSLTIRGPVSSILRFEPI